MRCLVAAVFAAAFIMGVPVSGSAQSPSADEIIRSLRPTAPSATTRGIRPVVPLSDTAAPAAAPAHAAGGAPAAAPRANVAPAPRVASAPSVNLTVQFATGSAELTPAAVRTLDELGRALTSATLSSYRFRIEGHTDTVGTREHNMALSDQRAAKVVEYLTSKWSVDRAKVQSVGMGQDQLVVQTGPGVPEPRNRRVTVINLGA